MNITDIVFENPELLTTLVVAIVALVRYQSSLSWREYRTIHLLKVALFPILDARTSLGVSLVNAKRGPADDAGFVGRYEGGLRECVADLLDGGFSYHLVNSVKSRPGDGDTRQFSQAHAVKIHGDEQTEVDLFHALDGESGVDVYAHVETAVTDPAGHLRATEQVDGDARGDLDGVFGDRLRTKP